MKSNELRIGNQIKYHDKIITVAGIVRNTIYYESKVLCFDGNVGDYKPFEPIPLTEEWLLKFGFEEKQHDSDQCFGHVLNDFWVMNESQIRVNCGGYILFDFKIEFVHQLQNLYFTITGEELAIA